MLMLAASRTRSIQSILTQLKFLKVDQEIPRGLFQGDICTGSCFGCDSDLRNTSRLL